MVDDKVATIQGPVKNRVLPAQGASPVFESSFEDAGEIFGVGVQSLATYTSVMNTDGTLYGECPNRGLLMAQDGVATFRATGVGKFTDTGGSSFRGAVYFQASAASLSDLNGKCFVYHWEVDTEGTAI
jgi:hypothetical protein